MLTKEALSYLYDTYRRKAKQQDRDLVISRDDFKKLMFHTKNTEEGLQQINYFLQLLKEGSSAVEIE